MKSETSTPSIPKEGFAGLRENWRFDLPSGLIVFLIALPLSVGIAIASGAPPSAGIVAAILGGILGSLFSGSYVTISGPAAGLIVVVLSGVETLGQGDSATGFRRALACFVMAGAIQIVFGLLKAGNLVFACAHSVVHGMLAAIGVIIITKQIPVLLGVKPHAKTILGMMGEIPDEVSHLNVPIAIIGVVGLALLLFWANKAPKKLKWIPGPLLVAVGGILAGQFIHMDYAHTLHLGMGEFMVGPSFLVTIPEKFSSLFIRPDFSQIFTADSLVVTASILLVASLESVLSTYAVDRLDPFRRRSDLNRDLMSKGVINLCCGMIGGLPVISEIVRSTANIDNGARTRWANFFHGTLMLVFIAALPELVHAIPLSALAAILLVVGFRLAHPKQLIQVYHHGWDELVTFLVTLGVTLASDLMLGIAAGVITSLVTQRFRGAKVKEIFRPSIRTHAFGNHNEIRVEGSMGCVGLLRLRRHMLRAPSDKPVIVNLESMRWMDFTVREQLPSVASAISRGGSSIQVRWPNRDSPSQMDN